MPDDSDLESDSYTLPRAYSSSSLGSGSGSAKSTKTAREAAFLLSLLRMTVKRFRSSKTQFFLGFSAILVVVLVVSALITIIAKAPVITLRLAELTGGEVDVAISADQRAGNGHRLNYTLVREIFSSPAGRKKALEAAETAAADAGPLFDKALFEPGSFDYSSPRISFDPVLVKALDCDNLPAGVDPMDPAWKYQSSSGTGTAASSPIATTAAISTNSASDGGGGGGFVDTFCPGATKISASFFVINAEREASMQLGREWTIGGPKKGNCFIQSNLARNLNLSVGELIFVEMTVGDLLSYGWNEAANTSAPLRKQGVYVPLQVERIFSSADGKFSIDIRDAVIVDYGSFLGYFSEHVNPAQDPDHLAALRQEVDLEHYAEDVMINLPPPRIDPYLSNNFDRIQANLVAFGSTVSYVLGFDRVQTSLPVLDSLQDTQFLGLFLGIVLNLVIFVLVFLSVLLIYSLLMVNVETRAFEMGVLRTVGITRRELVELLLIQAVGYSLPSWVFGLALGQLGTWLASIGFRRLTSIAISPWLTGGSVLWSTLLGFLIPIFASIFPIRVALGQSLQESLDVRRSKTKAVEVTVERSDAHRRINLSSVIAGVFLVGFGFFIYYLLPLSLLSFRLALLLNVFFVILLGMLLGLTLLGLNFQRPLESLVVALLLWWDRPAISKVVLKNLVAHRIRNRKTTVMFALSLGFILFVNVSYDLNIQASLYDMQRAQGAFLSVRSGRGYNATSGQVISLTPRLKELELALRTWEGVAPSPSSPVESWSWVTARLGDAVPQGSSSRTSNFGRTEGSRVHLYGLSPNFFGTAIPGFLTVADQIPNPDSWTLSENAYTLEGSRRLVLGSYARDGLRISLDDQFLLSTSFNDPAALSSAAVDAGVAQTGSAATDSLLGGLGGGGGSKTLLRRKKALSFLDSCPFFDLSKFPLGTQDAFVSFPSFVRLLDGDAEGVLGLPYRYLLIKLKPGTKRDEISSLKSMLNSALIDIEGGYLIFDYDEAVEPINTANRVMSYFFIFTTVVAMAISSFSLVSSMYTNIYEQTKEIGVLRAVGIQNAWMFRIYVYEAFVIVISSSILGAIIGTAVAWTMVLQRVLFTQLPIPISFPYGLLGIVFLAALLLAFVSSVGPANTILRKPIVAIMRAVS